MYFLMTVNNISLYTYSHTSVFVGDILFSAPHAQIHGAQVSYYKMMSYLHITYEHPPVYLNHL